MDRQEPLTGVTIIVDKLKAKQMELKLSDVAFSQKLGMSRPTWYLVKTGRRRPGLDFLTAVMRSFPDLTVDVMSHMTRTQTS